MNKQGFEFSFAWIFALIVGAFILFLAIYGVTKIIGTEQKISDAEIAKGIGVLMNPLETGFESGKTTSLILPTRTRVYNLCSDEENFGTQSIKISQESFGKWTDSNVEVEASNKYIFSEGYEEGEKFYIFSKPFEFPFKISDLIFLTSSKKEYCFVNPPEEIRNEISDLNQKNLLLNCNSESIKICFEKIDDCNIFVSENGKYVEKNDEKIYFEGDALMYAGIFSDKKIYECQLKRLMKRVRNLAEIYIEKENLISNVCDANLESDLLQLKTLTENLENSEELYLINNFAENIKEKNDEGVCKLW